ncbi:hypothetical protein KJB29_14785 [Geobacter grbiciae]|nr:hypothetical protein [Geobacter grbiciae]
MFHPINFTSFAIPALKNCLKPLFATIQAVIPCIRFSPFNQQSPLPVNSNSPNDKTMVLAILVKTSDQPTLPENRETLPVLPFLNTSIAYSIFTTAFGISSALRKAVNPQAINWSYA